MPPPSRDEDDDGFTESGNNMFTPWDQTIKKNYQGDAFDMLL